MKECLLYKKLKDGIVKCETCNHFCVIQKGKKGKCWVKENRNGKLFSLNYGIVCSLNFDPIEKKPFFHFLPGSKSLSIGCPGCNFSCKNCLNWPISQGPKIFKESQGEVIKPEEIVKIAIENNIKSISYTYTEPTIFLEYALAIMKLAKKKNLKNLWVSNGFMSKQTLNLITDYLDAINIDLKSFSEEFYQKICGAKLKPILENLKEIYRRKIWLEITTLLIPTLNDDEKTIKEIALFIKENLSINVPWHITRFSPDISWQLKNLPETPQHSIEKALKIAKKIGLKYVYSGNIIGIDSESTYCSKCGVLAIKRFGYSVERFDQDGKCRKCGNKLDLII